MEGFQGHFALHVWPHLTILAQQVLNMKDCPSLEDLGILTEMAHSVVAVVNPFIPTEFDEVAFQGPFDEVLSQPMLWCFGAGQNA